MGRNSFIRLARHAWKHSLEPVYPSDTWNLLHRLFWGLPIAFLIVIFRCKTIRRRSER